MGENRLKVVASEGRGPEKEKHRAYSGKKSYKQETQARFERLWLRDPELFDPHRNCMEEERVRRTWNLILTHVDLKGKRVADLGCGSGIFSRLMRDQGAVVDAVDIASQALKTFREEGAEGITLKQDYVPHTLLNDDTYDLVLAADLIAHVHPNERRLFFAELARLVKSDGFVVCSTPLDFRSENPLERFATLVESEFTIDDWILSNFSWYIKARDFFEAPCRFVKASQDPEYRALKLNERDTFSWWWFKFNSSRLMGAFWKVFGLPFRPFALILRQSGWILLGKEKAAQFVSEATTLSHAIFIGKRRSLIKHLPEKDAPQVRLGKKQVWE